MLLFFINWGFLFLIPVFAQSIENKQCFDPLRQRKVNSKANVFIGASLSFRHPGKGFGCSATIEKNSVDTYDAYRWAISILNRNSGKVFGVPVNDSFIPGITFGLKVLEDCGRPQLACRNAISLIPEMRSQKEYCKIKKKQLFVGMLGSTHRKSSGPLAEFLAEFQIPLISSQVISAKVRNVSLYPYFLRTAPNNGIQIKAVIELIKLLKWKRIAIVHTDDEYGIDASKETIRLANMESICIYIIVSMPVTFKFPIPSSVNLIPYQNVFEGIKKLLPGSGVVVLSRSAPTLIHFLEAALLDPLSKEFRWIFTENFGNGENIHKYSKILIGSFLVVPISTTISELQHFIKKIDVFNPKEFYQNPWLGYETMVAAGCRIPGTNFPQFHYFPECQDKISFENNLQLVPAIHAIYAFAHALRNAWLEKCEWQRGLCLKLKKLHRKDFFQNYLKKVNFEYSNTNRGIPELFKTSVNFDHNGDISSPNFIIYNYKKSGTILKFCEVMTFNGQHLKSDDKLAFFNKDGDVSSTILSSDCPQNGCTFCATL